MPNDLQKAPIATRFDHLLNVISSQRFLRMEGIGKEVPFFVVPYCPTEHLEIEVIRGQLIKLIQLLLAFLVNNVEAIFAKILPPSARSLQEEAEVDEVHNSCGDEHSFSEPKSGPTPTPATVPVPAPRPQETTRRF